MIDWLGSYFIEMQVSEKAQYIYYDSKLFSYVTMEVNLKFTLFLSIFHCELYGTWQIAYFYYI